jgi:hypothetical protein
VENPFSFFPSVDLVCYIVAVVHTFILDFFKFHCIIKNYDFIVQHLKFEFLMYFVCFMYLMFLEQQSNGQSHNVQIANNSFENVAWFRYVGKTPRNQNCMHKTLRTDEIQGAPASIQSRILCLPVYCLRTEGLKFTE